MTDRNEIRGSTSWTSVTDVCVEVDGCCWTHSPCFSTDDPTAACEGWPCLAPKGDDVNRVGGPKP